MVKHKCKRCGRCCRDMGTEWTSSKHPLIKAIIKTVSDDYYTDFGDCIMLRIENGRATCLLEKYLGRDAKPRVCRDYPFDGEPCFREQTIVNSK